MDALEQRAFDFFKTLSDFKMRKHLEDLEEELKEKKSDLKEATNIFEAFSTRTPLTLEEVDTHLMKAIPKEVVQTAQAVTDSKNELMQEAQQAYAKAEAYYNELKAYYESLSDQISKVDLQDELSSAVDNVEEEVTSLVKDTIKDAQQEIDDVKQDIKDTMQDIKDAKQEFMDYLNALRDNLSEMWQDVLDAIDKLKNSDIESILFNDPLDNISKLFGDDDNEVSSDDSEKSDADKDKIEDIIQEAIKKSVAFKGLPNLAGNWLNDQLNSYTEKLANMDLLGNAKELLTNQFQSLISSEQFENIVETTSDWHEKMAGGVADAVTSASELGDKITQGAENFLFNELPDAANSFLLDTTGKAADAMSKVADMGGDIIDMIM